MWEIQVVRVRSEYLVSLLSESYGGCHDGWYTDRLTEDG